MFFVLGFLPGFIVAGILKGMGILRIPREVELLGLDFAEAKDEEAAAADVREASRSL